MKTMITKNIIKAVAFIAVAASLAACAGGAQERQFAQVKSACAELGLAPGASAFSQCTADLDSTLFALDHP